MRSRQKSFTRFAPLTHFLLSLPSWLTQIWNAQSINQAPGARAPHFHSHLPIRGPIIYIASVDIISIRFDINIYSISVPFVGGTNERSFTESIVRFKIIIAMISDFFFQAIYCARATVSGQCRASTAKVIRRLLLLCLKKCWNATARIGPTSVPSSLKYSIYYLFYLAHK